MSRSFIFDRLGFFVTFAFVLRNKNIFIKNMRYFVPRVRVICGIVYVDPLALSIC